MTVQLAVSLMSHSIIYYTVGGEHDIHLKPCSLHRLLPEELKNNSNNKDVKEKESVTIFCKWSQNFKDHFLLLVLHLFLEKMHQFLSNIGGCKLLFAGL